MITEKLPDNVKREGGDGGLEPRSVPIPTPVKVDLPSDCTWSNEVINQALATYFDPTKPNLAVDFGLAGLQPIIREPQGDVFLCQDSAGKFYQWGVLDGKMWHLQDVSSLQDAVSSVMRDSGILKREQVWNLSRS